MIKWAVIVCAAALVGGCASSPSYMLPPSPNLSWQDLKPVILPEPEAPPATVSLPPPTPVQGNPQLDVLDPAPAPAAPRLLALAEEQESAPVPAPAKAVPAANAGARAARRPAGHHHAHRYTGVAAKSGNKAN